VPLAGRSLDRWGLRKVLIPAVVAFALSQFLVSQAHSPWQLAGALVVLSLAAAFHSSVGYAKIISQWFARWRGLVLGLVVALGAGAGSAAVPQITRILIERYGWRGAYMGLGAIILVVGVPIMVFCLREPPRGGAERPTTADAGLTRAEALRQPVFWMLFLAILLASMSLVGTVAHAFPMYTERGISPVAAGTALSLVFIGSICGQFSSGFLVDRLASSKAAMPYFAAAVAGLLIEHTTTNVPLLFGGALLHGLGQGGENALAAYLVSRFFGLKHFGSIYSLIFAASNIGIAIGIMSMGICHDLAGGYEPMRWVFGGVMVGSFCLMGLLGPYRYTKAGLPIQSLEGEITLA
jgi:MFS family permease